MRTWIERVSLSANFAGREHNGDLPGLDRIKAMKTAGWEVTVLTVKGADYVIVLGYYDQEGK